MAKFCQNCGGEMGDGNFCAKCGAQTGQQVVNQAATGSGLPKDNLAVASLVCGIVGFLCCTYVAIPGLVLGIMSLNNSSKGKVDGKNKWMAIVGLICSIIGLILMVVNIVNMVNGTNDVYNDIMNSING